MGGAMQWPYAQASHWATVGKTAWQTYIEPRLPRKTTQLPSTAGFSPRNISRCFSFLEAGPLHVLKSIETQHVQKLITRSKH